VRVRPWELSSFIQTFAAKKSSLIVGVLSLIQDSFLGLPSDGAFKGELDQIREQGKITEISNQAVEESYRNSVINSALIKLCIENRGEADIGIASVSARHKKVYELMGFELIGDERFYSNETKDRVVLMAVDVNRLKSL
jgi:N-acetylglutamate synthase-like GNAT family acetyltransferase